MLQLEKYHTLYDTALFSHALFMDMLLYICLLVSLVVAKFWGAVLFQHKKPLNHYVYCE